MKYLIFLLLIIPACKQKPNIDPRYGIVDIRGGDKVDTTCKCYCRDTLIVFRYEYYQQDGMVTLPDSHITLKGYRLSWKELQYIARVPACDGVTVSNGTDKPPIEKAEVYVKTPQGNSLVLGRYIFNEIHTQ